MLPGVVFYLSTFYKRNELASRVGLFYGTNSNTLYRTRDPSKRWPKLHRQYRALFRVRCWILFFCGCLILGGTCRSHCLWRLPPPRSQVLFLAILVLDRRYVFVLRNHVLFITAWLFFLHRCWDYLFCYLCLVLVTALPVYLDKS